MTTPVADSTAATVHRTLLRCLATDPRTREPMNALVTWTELGKGLAGTLDDVGAERGLLRKLICHHGIEHGEDVDLKHWCYRVAPEQRLDSIAAAGSLQHVQTELSEVLADHSEPASRSPAARRALFIAVVKGWFAVGLDIMRALPPGDRASEQARMGALAAWCERHLPSEETEAEAVAPRADGKIGLRVI